MDSVGSDDRRRLILTLSNALMLQQSVLIDTVCLPKRLRLSLYSIEFQNSCWVRVAKSDEKAN